VKRKVELRGTKSLVVTENLSFLQGLNERFPLLALGETLFPLYVIRTEPNLYHFSYSCTFKALLFTDHTAIIRVCFGTGIVMFVKYFKAETIPLPPLLPLSVCMCLSHAQTHSHVYRYHASFPSSYKSCSAPETTECKAVFHLQETLVVLCVFTCQNWSICESEVINKVLCPLMCIVLF